MENQDTIKCWKCKEQFVPDITNNNWLKRPCFKCMGEYINSPIGHKLEKEKKVKLEKEGLKKCFKCGIKMEINKNYPSRPCDVCFNEWKKEKNINHRKKSIRKLF